MSSPVPYRVGIIGFKIGKSFYETLQGPEFENITVKAIARKTDSWDEEFRTQAGDTLLTTNNHDVTRNPDIDVVIVASPDAFHYRQAWEALCMEKHVLLEKPAALDRAEGNQLTTFAASRRLSLDTGTQLRVEQDDISDILKDPDINSIDIQYQLPEKSGQSDPIYNLFPHIQSLFANPTFVKSAADKDDLTQVVFTIEDHGRTIPVTATMGYAVDPDQRTMTFYSGEDVKVTRYFEKGVVDDGVWHEVRRTQATGNTVKRYRNPRAQLLENFFAGITDSNYRQDRCLRVFNDHNMLMDAVTKLHTR